MHLSIELYFLNEKKLTLHTPKTEGRGGVCELRDTSIFYM